MTDGCLVSSDILNTYSGRKHYNVTCEFFEKRTKTCKLVGHTGTYLVLRRDAYINTFTHMHLILTVLM